MDALVLMKRTGNLLNEMEDLTKQIAESIDRNDRVSMEMLVAMREEPLGKLHEADRILREQLADMPDREGAAQLAAMLNGAAPSRKGTCPKCSVSRSTRISAGWNRLLP